MRDNLDQSVIKSLNRARILQAFKEKDVIQKKELADYLNLSITTITMNTRLLLAEGLIEEVGIAASTGGRKPVIFKFARNSKVSIGVDISPRQIRIILTNLASEILDQRKIDVQKLDMHDMLDALKVVIEAMLRDNHYTKQECLGVGLSLPGVVDASKKYLINAPNLKVENYDLHVLEKELGLEVFAENDANAGAFAELILGMAADVESAVYVSIANGVGCGIISNRKVAKGTYNRAGEFGHMRISDQNIRCSCGQTGCWEIFSSECALLNYYSTLSGHEIADLEAFFQQYQEKDSYAKQALEIYLNYLFIGIENIMLGLDPEMIIVGGEIASHLKKIRPLIEMALEKRQSTLLSRDNKLAFSVMAPQTAMIGSSLLPLKKIFGY